MEPTTRKDGTPEGQVEKYAGGEKPYNEWTNHETWITYRWLTDDDVPRQTWQARAAGIRLAADGDPERAVQQLARVLLESVEAECLNNVAGLAEDLLNCALQEVVWCEVARGILKNHLPPVEPAPDALFPLGQVVATPGVLRRVPHDERAAALARHARGNWGDVSQAEWEDNETALREGLRLASEYRTKAGERLWVITDDDRSVTTLILPEEY